MEKVEPESKKPATFHDHDEAATPKPVSSLDLETSARTKRFLQAQVGPAVMGLISAALLVAVVALYIWGATVSSDSTNGSALAQAWVSVLPWAAILLGLVVAVGLPVLWAYKKGVSRIVMVLALEGIMLLLALLISGFFIFSGTSSTTGPGPNPVGCGCGAAGGGGSLIQPCMECLHAN